MRLFLIGIIFLLFCNSGRAVAQEDDSGLPPDRYLGSLRFQLLNGGVILCKAQIGNFPDSLNFVFDTGCGGISLDSTTAVHFKLTPRLGPLVVRGIGGTQQQRLLDRMSIHLGGVTLDSVTIHVCDYGLLSSVYGEQIDGIIGYTFFSRYVVRVDYDSSRIDIYSPGKVEYARGGYLLKPYVAGLPMLPGQLNDARDINSRFYFDTGAGLCLLFSSQFAADSAVFGVKKKKPVRAEGAGLGGKKEMELTTLKTFTLGPFRFRQIPTYVFDDNCDVTGYPELGGLIGNDLLRRFNLILNYGRSEIYIRPNGAFHQPFDYSYSGVTIGLVGGRIVVTDVMKDSPGEKAGLREGDVILEINGDARQDLQIYQGLLRTMGPRVKVLVRRESGDQALLWLKVKSII